MASTASEKKPGDEPAQRLDKWLWFARAVKSRTTATQLVVDGKVRINRVRVVKPSQPVRPGDVLTIALRGKVLVLRVVSAGQRRGPPAEARLLYEMIEGATIRKPVPDATGGQRQPGSARPTKRDRRLIDRLMEQE